MDNTLHQSENAEIGVCIPPYALEMGKRGMRFWVDNLEEGAILDSHQEVHSGTQCLAGTRNSIVGNLWRHKMKIRIGRFIPTISLSVAETLPELVDRFARKHYSNIPNKRARVKAFRELGDKGNHELSTYFLDSRHWVEEHFEDNGHGPIKK
jgi:hypothetical protein